MMAVEDSDSLLSIDVGTVNTRATLFDLVDGRYRLVASGISATTIEPPLVDVREGVRRAMDQLHAITGRHLVDEAEMLIIPTTSEGDGVDVFAATASAGPSIRTVLVGLMSGGSMERARGLISSTYLQLVAEAGLQDGLREDERIDAILAARPDLILIIGGTDGGASRGVLRMVDTVGVALALMPPERRPSILYAGNNQLAPLVREQLGDRYMLTLAPNIQPTLEQANPGAVRRYLSAVISDLRCARNLGYDELWHWAGGQLMPTSEAFGRVIRYLSQIYDPDMGVLGIDLGAGQITVAAAFSGDLRLRVRTDLGMGRNLHRLLKYSSIEKIRRWLPVDIPEQRARDYIFNRALNPGTVPVEVHESHLEFALARELMRVAVADARRCWPSERWGKHAEWLPPLEPILAGGAVLGRAPRPAYAALALLDALQPTAVTTLIVDPHNLASGLGAAAASLPMMTVQVLGSESFISLGTVISPVGRGGKGRPVLRLLLQREHAEEVEEEVRYGQILVLPLKPGERGRLTLTPERSFDVGFGGVGKGGALRVAGGAVGVIIDARGRPLTLPREAGERRELNAKWLWEIGAVD